MRGSSFAGMSLNQKILPLDISRPTEFPEDRWEKPPRVIARLAQKVHRNRGNNDGDALSLSDRSERPCRYCATNERDELASSHGSQPHLGNGQISIVPGGGVVPKNARSGGLQCRSWVNLYRSILPVQCRLFLQLRMYRCVAANVETGHFETHAPQQKWIVIRSPDRLVRAATAAW